MFNEAVSGTGILLILNNHKKYMSIRLNKDYMDKTVPILDSWNVCQSLKNDGANICNLGDMNI